MKLTKNHGRTVPADLRIGPSTVSMVSPRHLSSPFQSKIPAKPDSDFIHHARFAPRWHFGEGRHACAKGCMLHLTMGRVSKVVFLVVLLLLAGVPGFASHLCTTPSMSHMHACCMGHNHQAASLCETTATLSGNSSCCCQVMPFGSTVVPSISPSVSSHEGTYGSQAVSDVAVDLPMPAIRTSRGLPHLVKLRHPPVHALLCTFLV